VSHFSNSRTLASVVDEKSHRHSPTKAYFLAQHQPEVPLPDGVAILTKLDCLEFECNKAEEAITGGLGETVGRVRNML
jgi:hypothetical protein